MSVLEGFVDELEKLAKRPRVQAQPSDDLAGLGLLPSAPPPPPAPPAMKPLSIPKPAAPLTRQAGAPLPGEDTAGKSLDEMMARPKVPSAGRAKPAKVQLPEMEAALPPK